MGFKTGLISGAIIGYVIASKMDPTTRDRIQTQVTDKVSQLRDDPRVNDLIDSVKTVATEVVDRVDHAVDDLGDVADDLAEQRPNT